MDSLKEIYKNVEDIDLTAGIWVEKYAKGSTLPHTVHCLFVEQLTRNIVADRHWYERQDRPDAFSYGKPIRA